MKTWLQPQTRAKLLTGLLFGGAILCAFISLHYFLDIRSANAQARRYDSAPVCTTARAAGCRREIHTTVNHTNVQTRYRQHTTETDSTVVINMPGGGTSDVYFSDEDLSDEFPAGSAVVAEQWNGSVVKLTNNAEESFTTDDNPDEGVSNDVTLGLLFAGAAAFCVGYWWWKRRKAVALKA